VQTPLIKFTVTEDPALRRADLVLQVRPLDARFSWRSGLTADVVALGMSKLCVWYATGDRAVGTWFWLRSIPGEAS
jgi:hypothetical protein